MAMPMTLPPDTRASLLLRVRDPADQAAWHEFVEIYWPVIHRLARLKGMQSADADDIAQQVLVAVSKAVEKREHDSKRARFRTWLDRVARNAILNALTRGKPDRAAGGLDANQLLEQHARADGPDSDLLRLECRREVFRWAARQIREEFQDATWEAFWQTAIEGRDCDAVANELKKSTGSIYMARSRVMKRLQEKVAEYEGEP
jgi:RNA polymerase sigma factor (sigma-70 family)